MQHFLYKHSQQKAQVICAFYGGQGGAIMEFSPKYMTMHVWSAWKVATSVDQCDAWILRSADRKGMAWMLVKVYVSTVKRWRQARGS